MINMMRREKQFSVLLAGNLLSKIGDGVHEFVFIITVLEVTHNTIASAGVIYFFHFIPYLILGPIGGVLSDRLPRRYLMLGADFARLLVTIVLCTLLISNQINAISLALLGMLMTAFRTLFQPAFQAAIPSIVRADNLPQVNSATQIAGEVGAVLGPALGGASLALFVSPGHVLMLDAATYLLSAICIIAVPIPTEHVATVPSWRFTSYRLYGDFWQNLLRMLEKPQLLITILYSSACILFVGAALRILIPALMKSVGFSSSLVGYAISLIALGAVAGAILCSKIARDFSTRSLMLYWCLYGIVLSLLPLCIVNAVAMLVGCFVLGAFGAFVDVVLATNIQRHSNNHNIGKNFSFFSTLANTGEALSGSFAGLVVWFSPIGISVTFIGLLVASIAYIGKLKSVVGHE